MSATHITRFCLALALIVCLGAQTAQAEGKLGGRLKEKIQERKAEKLNDGENGMPMDDNDGGSCAKRDQQISRMMQGFMGKKAYGPDADLKDIAYGDYERQKIDVFFPTNKAPEKLAPIIIMIRSLVTRDDHVRWFPARFARRALRRLICLQIASLKKQLGIGTQESGSSGAAIPNWLQFWTIPMLLVSASRRWYRSASGMEIPQPQPQRPTDLASS